MGGTVRLEHGYRIHHTYRRYHFLLPSTSNFSPLFLLTLIPPSILSSIPSSFLTHHDELLEPLLDFLLDDDVDADAIDDDDDDDDILLLLDVHCYYYTNGSIFSFAALK